MEFGRRTFLALATLILATCLPGTSASAQATCETSPTTHCMNQERFRVGVTWRGENGVEEAARAEPLASPAAGLFTLGQDKMMVKVLNGCSINDRVWVFAATPTDLGYDLQVEDVRTGAVKTYSSPRGERPEALTDTGAFATCTESDRSLPLIPGAAEGLEIRPKSEVARWAKQSVGPCEPGPATACLLQRRFRVEVDWESFDDTDGPARTVAGTADGSSDETALFWFFGQENWEALVRMEDRCETEDSFHVRAAASTNVGFDLTVTDTLTGMSKTYSNPLGETATPIVEDAFSTCDAVEEIDATVRFVSDQSVMLSAERAEAELVAEVVDGEGDPVPGAVIDWSSDAPGVASVEPTGPLSAVVHLEGHRVGHADVTARFGDAEARGSVLLTDPAADAVLIDSGTVLEKRPDLLVLDRTARTETLSPGEILVSGDRAGVLVHLESVILQPDRVLLETRPAKITEAFEDLDVEVEGESVERKVLIDPREEVLLVQHKDGRVLAKRLLDDLECEAGGRDVEIEFEGPEVTLTFEMKPRVELDVGLLELERFSTSVTGELNLTGSTGSLRFDGTVRDEARCYLELPDLSLPPLPVSVFTFTLGLTPELGVQASAEFSGPSFQITGPNASARGFATGGILYSESGWGTLSDSGWSGEANLGADIELDTDVGFDTSVGPYSTLDAGVVVDLGRGFLGVEVANFRFAEIQGFATLKLGFPKPIDPGEPEYVGPRWDLLIGEEGRLKAELASGLLKDLLERLDIPTSFDGDFELFAVEELLAGSPRPIEIDATTTSETCAGQLQLDPSSSEEALFAVRSSKGTGKVQLWSAPVDDGPLELVAEDVLESQGPDSLGTVQWTPEPTQTGAFRFYPRLVVDEVSQIAPYGAGPELFESIELTTEAGENDGVPVIESIEPNPLEIPRNSEGTYRVKFCDPDGDLDEMHFSIVEEEGMPCNDHYTSFIRDQEGQSEGEIVRMWDCRIFAGRCVWSVVLEDERGNTSEPVLREQICTP